MEYLSIKGRIKLVDKDDADEVSQDVLDQLKSIEFYQEDGFIRIFMLDRYIHIEGEGTLDEEQSNRLIDILKQLQNRSDPDFYVEICRIRWELYITLGYRVDSVAVANA